MKQNKTITRGMAALALALALMAGCDTPAGNSGTAKEGARGTISNGAARYKAEPVSGGYQVVSAYTDGTEKILTVYLGKVSNAPIVWDQAGYWYRGAGFPNPEYTISETQSQSLTETQSATQLVSNSVSKTNSNEVGVEVGAGYKVEAKAGAEAFGLSASVKASVETSLKGHWTNVSSSTAATTEELSKTFETAKTSFVEKSKAVKFKFGENGEAFGHYRYTSFGICDVYITLVFDAATGKLEQKLTTILARSDRSEAFDYAEEQDGFVKTAEGPKLELTDADIASLFAYQPTTTPAAQPSVHWSATRTNDLDNIGSASRDETFNPHFNAALLKSSGYTKVKIDVAFRYKAEEWPGGRLRLQVVNANNTAVLGTKDDITNIVWDNGWYDGSFSVTTSIDSLNSAEGAFMLLWSKAGISTYCVGRRTVTITALP